MEKIVNVEQMKKIDQYTIDEVGIPSMVLVEHAAKEVFDYVVENYGLNQKILVVFGNGNNGADAISTARMLHHFGYTLDLYDVSIHTRKSPECYEQRKIAKNFGISFVSDLNFSIYDILIDGIFGIGLNREVKEPYNFLINEMNKSGLPILSIDIPSGIDGTNGRVLGCAIIAKTTITFSYKKMGHLLGQAPNHTGQLVCRDIGLYKGKEVTDLYQAESYAYMEKAKLPIRTKTANKGNCGKVLLFAGGEEYPGAAILSMLSAYRTGAGMVRVITHKDNQSDLLKLNPGAMLITYEDTYDESAIKAAFEWCDVLAMGPGMGRSKISKSVFEVLVTLLEHKQKKAVVMDADALNIVAENETYLERLKGIENFVLTPHLKELSRLVKKTVKEVKSDLISTTKEFVRKWNVVLVAKDAKTIVIEPDELHIYINQSGNEGMATAGSGDVLTGMVAAFMGQGMPAYEAAYTAVYIHGCAGDLAYKKYNRGLVASDIINEIHEMM